MYTRPETTTLPPLKPPIILSAKVLAARPSSKSLLVTAPTPFFYRNPFSSQTAWVFSAVSSSLCRLEKPEHEPWPRWSSHHTVSGALVRLCSRRSRACVLHQPTAHLAETLSGLLPRRPTRGTRSRLM